MVRRSGRCMAGAVTALSRPVESSLGLFPISPVEPPNRELERRIEAIGVHAPRLRVRTRLVETLHPAAAAEQMLRRTAAEAVGGKRVAAGQQFERSVRHHDVQKTGHPTDRAIAVERRNRRLADFRLEPHRAAMAATLYL